MLPQEHRQLQAEGIDHSEHVLEGKLDDDEDEDTVDVRHSLGGHRVLVEVHNAKQYRSELKMGRSVILSNQIMQKCQLAIV